MINPGSSIFIKRYGSLIKAEALHRSDYGNTWWVKFEEDGHTEVSLYEEDELIEWNSVDEPCVCGSKITGQSNRHSWYCKAK